jgi:hypothetical protein
MQLIPGRNLDPGALDVNHSDFDSLPSDKNVSLVFKEISELQLRKFIITNKDKIVSAGY